MTLKHVIVVPAGDRFAIQSRTPIKRKQKGRGNFFAYTYPTEAEALEIARVVDERWSDRDDAVNFIHPAGFIKSEGRP